jgi:hypothetical protein
MHRLIIDGETVITGSFNKLMGKPRGILIPTEEPEKIGPYVDSVAMRESFWKALFRPKAAPLPKGVIDWEQFMNEFKNGKE